MATPELSIVVPCHNEEGNLPLLADAIDKALTPLATSYELIITDDRSDDESWQVVRQLAATDPRVRGQRMRENRGESAASWAGMQIARGRYIVTMDADLQNDPKDLPQFIAALSHADCVCGSRVDSRDVYRYRPLIRVTVWKMVKSGLAPWPSVPDGDIAVRRAGNGI